VDIERLQQPDVDQLKVLERAIVHALVPHMTNTDPLLGVIALARALRTMLRNIPREHQTTMLRLVEDFLRGRITPRHEGLLWLPGEPGTPQ
jgi:hypothetical protein